MHRSRNCHSTGCLIPGCFEEVGSAINSRCSHRPKTMDEKVITPRLSQFLSQSLGQTKMPFATRARVQVCERHWDGNGEGGIRTPVAGYAAKSTSSAAPCATRTPLQSE